MEPGFSDEIFMRRCISLASMGAGKVSPNPMVGAIIVYENKIVSEGFHQIFGGPHAETNAIKALKNPELLKDCTLYVNMEPCSHFGKTPPCVNLIISCKIPKVVIGTKDPNPLVSGKGVLTLEQAGLSVKVGILEKECRWLNRRFFIFFENKRIYVILKWAQSFDGFIDINRTANTPVGPKWITNEPARQLVHKWRSEETAIMAGTNTILFDNPKLTVRDWPGRQALRVILDKTLRLPLTSFVFDKSAPTIVFTEREKPSEENLEYYKIKFNGNVLENILTILFQRGTQSLFVEGGAQLLQNFIDNEMWDEARIFYGPDNFQDGLPAPVLKNNILAEETAIGNSKYRLFLNIK